MRLGELCAGYGGLGMAVEEVFGATTAWFSEFDAAPSKILAHHWPGVPNYGDMTKIDWASIEHVDIVSGGTPCQDLSAAGRRAGMTEGTRSNLWVQMREAIAIQSPKYVVWENVRGAFSAEASSDLEQCPGCMGDARDGGPVLRALGRVLGDLSDLGYDAEWRGLRAADVGACHARFRVFVLASHRHNPGRGEQRGAIAVRPEHSAAQYKSFDAEQPSTTTDAVRFGQWQHPGKPFAEEAGARSSDQPSDRDGVQHATDWGPYGAGVRRWERVVGRRAPRPTELAGRANGERLSPRFTEWMMGLPEGWVTNPTIGISRNEQLKACGNGVVPQQAVAALRDMLFSFQQGRQAA